MLRLTAAITLAFVTTVSAQVPLTSPLNYLNREADSWSTYFGAFPAARYMLFDGELGNRTPTIKEVAYRDDYRAFQSEWGMGRNWINATLDMANCDMSKIQPTFSLNATTTPTRVFSGSITWSNNIGHPSTLPAAWSKQFPFSTNWTSSGVGDICLDHDFSGGTLDNSAAWGTNRPYLYFLDAVPTEQVSRARPFFHGEGGTTTGGCIDFAQVTSAMNFLFCDAYATNYPDQQFAGNYQLRAHSYFTAPNQVVVNLINFRGSAAGIDLTPFISCNRLYLDVSKFTFRMISTAGPITEGAFSGYVYPTGTPKGLLKADPSYAGVPLWAQTVWNDSSFGVFKLSRAVSTTIPRMPFAVNRAALIQTDTAMKATTGYGPYYATSYNPVIRYTR